MGGFVLWVHTVKINTLLLTKNFYCGNFLFPLTKFFITIKINMPPLVVFYCIYFLSLYMLV